MWLAKVTYSDETTEEMEWTDLLSKECKPIYSDMEFNYATGNILFPIIKGFTLRGKDIDHINFTQCLQEK